MNIPGDTSVRYYRHIRTATGLWIAVLRCIALLVLASGYANVSGAQSPVPPPTIGVVPHALTDPGLKGFMEQQLGSPLNDWPLHNWNLPRLTLAAWYFDPSLEAMRKQWRGPGKSLAVAGGEFIETRDLVEPTRLLQQKFEWEVRARVRSNLWKFVFLEREEALLEQLQATYTNLVEMARLRASIGWMPREQIARFRRQLDQTRLRLIQTRLEKMDSREHLADALALPVNTLFDVELTFDFLRNSGRSWTNRDLARQVLHGRPDILEALVDYAAAETEVRAEIAKKLPELEIPVSCWWDAQQNRWAVRVDDWFPAEVWRGKVVKRAESRRVAAASRLLKLQSDLLDKLNHDAVLYSVSVEKLAGLDELVDSSRVHHELTKARYQAGIVAAPELLAARAQWIAARIRRLNAQADLQRALGSLEDAMQIPFEHVREPRLLTELQSSPQIRSGNPLP